MNGGGIERIISLFYLFIYFVLFWFFLFLFFPFLVSRFCNYIKILTCIILCWLDFFLSAVFLQKSWLSSSVCLWRDYSLLFYSGVRITLVVLWNNVVFKFMGHVEYYSI